MKSRVRKVTAALIGLLTLAMGVGEAMASDCGCTQAGAYKDPAVKALAATSSAYSVSATTTTVSVQRSSDKTTVFESLRQTGAAWGFIGDNRFVYHYLSGTVTQMHNVILYDLVARRTIWQLSTAVSSSRISVSPHSKYLLYSAISGGMTALTVVDVASGAVRYQTQFTRYTPPGSPGDNFGVARWGFSPEAANRTFVFGSITSQSTVQLTAVNLARGQVVVNQILGSGWWQFSPCGDALGLVSQYDQTNLEVSLFKTSSLQPRFAGRTVALADVNLSTTLASHLVTVGTTTYTLAPNVADDACPTISTVSIPTPVTGGTTVTATVTLTAAAPFGGVVVDLLSSNPAVAKPTVASVAVPEGSTTKTFSVKTVPVAADTAVDISTKAGSVTKTASLTVKRPVAKEVRISPSPIDGGTSGTVTAVLTGPAPAGGVEVTLSSSNPAVAKLAQDSVRVRADSTSESASFTTTAVSADTSVTITASAGDVTKSRVVTVRVHSISSFHVSPTSVAPGAPSTGFVILNSPAPPGGTAVALASSNGTRASVPSTVVVPAGLASATFPIATSGGPEVQVTISANLREITKTAVLTISPPPAVSAITLSPSRVIGGGSGSTGTVTLTKPAWTGGTIVGIWSSDTGLATVPGRVDVPAGATSVSFPVSTPTAVSTEQTVTIRVSGGDATREAVLTIVPAGVTRLTVSPNYVEVWGLATGEVTLGAPAPAGGTVVTLTTANASVADVGSSVTVPAGSTTASFGVFPGQPGTTTISGSANGGTASASVTVYDPCAGNPRCSEP